MDKKLLVWALVLLGVCDISASLRAQSEQLQLSPAGSFAYSRFYSAYAALFDRRGMPYLYSAAKELGLVVFNVSNPSQPIPVDTLRGAALHQLDVTNLVQRGHLLYLALGGIQGISQAAGLAIVDIQNPEKPSVLGFWSSPDFKQGCAIVRVEGDHAYLGVMEEGLLVLNVANPTDIQWVSRFKPDPNWPGAVITPPNARGLEVRDNIAYLCYDAGGLRVIDLGNKQQPVEIGRYANPALLAKAAPAYNNIRLAGDYAFLAVDYCGLEVLDIGQAANPKSIAWLNPWNCNGASWFGSAGHLNELVLAAHDSLLFASGGDSELLVFDVSQPTLPRAVGSYAMPGDSTAAWGIDVWGNLVALSCINNSALPFFQPFYADFGGLQLLYWQKTSGLPPLDHAEKLRVSPNPTLGPIRIEIPENIDFQTIEIFNSHGIILKTVPWSGGETAFDLGGLPEGLYFIKVRTKGKMFMGRVVKVNF